MKYLNLKLSPAVMVAIVFGVLAVFGGAKAFQSYSSAPKIVVEGNQIYNEAVDRDTNFSAPREEEALGGTNPNLVSNYFCVNNVCEYDLVGTISGANATTTLYSFVDPFLITTSSAGGGVVVKTDDGGQGYTGNTSTVDVARIVLTGGSASKFTATCGAASDPTAAPSLALLTAVFATSSVGMVENNLTAALGAYADGGTVAKIALSPTYPYLNCIAGTITSSTLFTSASSNANFAGKVTVRVRRTL